MRRTEEDILLWPYGTKASHRNEPGKGLRKTVPMIRLLGATNFRLSREALQAEMKEECSFVTMPAISTMANAYRFIRDGGEYAKMPRSVKKFLKETRGSCVFEAAADEFCPLQGIKDKRIVSYNSIFVGSVHPLSTILKCARELTGQDLTENALRNVSKDYEEDFIGNDQPDIARYADLPVALTVDGGLHLLRPNDRVVDADMKLIYVLHRRDEFIRPEHTFYSVGKDGTTTKRNCTGWEDAPLRREGHPHTPLMRDLSKR